jgi:uncharacterized YceG family protein
VDEQGAGVTPAPRGQPPRRPSRRQVVRRRTFLLALLVLGLGGLGWLAVAAIGGGTKSSATTAAPPSTRSSSLIYTTETVTTNGKTTETVIAMPKPFHIVFPEGFTIAQMAQRVAAVRLIARHERHVRARLSLRSYVAAVRRTGAPPCFRSRAASEEGFLFPATYEFFKQTTSGQLVSEQLDAFCAKWRRLNLSYARSKNLTPYDVLIIASMVEKEAAVPAERPLIAAVIYNRLHNRMALGIDATLRYGLNIPPTSSIRESQLHSSSPYNTRDRPGLPPTPIANPGLASMKAAAQPAKVDYLYFVRKPDKLHHFFTASKQAFDEYSAAHGYGVH